jgi:pimeloyl-ACP methyl ester carboxylesterase
MSIHQQSVMKLIVSTLCAVAMSGAAAADPPRPTRAYIEMRYGQMHYAIARPTTDTAKVPLVLLHQTANSLVEYGPLISEMAKDRLVIAIDTPGYGGSDAPPSLPKIEDYAGAIAEVLGSMGYNASRPVDIVGNHTGAFIATAIATAEPKLVRRLGLVGVFVVPDEEIARRRKNLRHPESGMEVFEKFCSRLPGFRDTYAAEGVPDWAWSSIKADSLRSFRTREYGHDAAYEYAQRAKTELPKVTQPVLLLAVADNIEEATRRSAPLFKNAQLRDLPHVRTGKGVYDGIFYSHTGEIAHELRSFLDQRTVGMN